MIKNNQSESIQSRWRNVAERTASAMKCERRKPENANREATQKESKWRQGSRHRDLNCGDGTLSEEEGAANGGARPFIDMPQRLRGRGRCLGERYMAKGARNIHLENIYTT